MVETADSNIFSGLGDIFTQGVGAFVDIEVAKRRAKIDPIQTVQHEIRDGDTTAAPAGTANSLAVNPSQIISGVDNRVVYAGGALLLMFGVAVLVNT